MLNANSTSGQSVRAMRAAKNTSNLTIVDSGEDDFSHHAFNQSLFSRLFGAPSASRHNALVEVNFTSPPAQLSVGDLLHVDFEQRKLTHEGLYIICIGNDWIGVRQLDVTGDGWRMYDNGPGKAPRLLTDADLASFQVVGLVKDVYKSKWAIEPIL